MEKINLDNKMFDKLKRSFNYQLDKIISNIMSENFESGKMNIALDISVIEKEVHVNTVNGIEKRTFETPAITYNVKSELKQIDKSSDVVIPYKQRLTKENGLYVLEDVELGQAKFIL